MDQQQQQQQHAVAATVARPVGHPRSTTTTTTTRRRNLSRFPILVGLLGMMIGCLVSWNGRMLWNMMTDSTSLGEEEDVILGGLLQLQLGALDPGIMTNNNNPATTSSASSSTNRTNQTIRGGRIMVDHAQEEGQSSKHNNNNHTTILQNDTQPRPFEFVVDQTSQQQNQTHDDQQMSNRSSFSSVVAACLMVMDENHRLPEWLAYHSYMLPLRHVVLLVDPLSDTSPLDIVHRWRPYVEIVVWNFTDLVGYTKKAAGRSSSFHSSIHRHLLAQNLFYPQCTTHLMRQQQQQRQQQQKQHSTEHDQEGLWITFHDVDEYMYLDPTVVPNAVERMASQPGSIQHFLNELLQSSSSSSLSNNHKNQKQLEYRQKVVDSNCVVMERTLFSAISEEPQRIQQDVPSYLNASHFETLSWLHRASHDYGAVNGLPKSMIFIPPQHDHVTTNSTMTNQSSTSTVLPFSGRVHRVLKTCPWNEASYVPIRIRHYIGSWEVYTSRVDTRVGGIRSRQVYLYRSQLGDTVDDAVRGWIQGFVQMHHHNVTRIQSLLHGTGLVQISAALQRKIQHTNWSLTADQMQTQIQKVQKKDPLYVQWLKQQYPELDPARENTTAGRRRRRRGRK